MSRDTHRFNTDILLQTEDRGLAQLLYPRIAYALDDEKLRACFKAIDAVANRAKRRSRNWGCRAVALVTFALLAASAEPLGAHFAYADEIEMLAAACGIAGALIGWRGLLYAKSKRLWLENRLRTETMRLFHFRTLVALSDLIVTGKRAVFLERRAKLFAAFEADVLADPQGVLDTLLDPDREEDGLHVPIPEAPADADPALVEEFTDAYRRLRVQHQLGYARYKLRMDGKLISNFPRQQAFWLGTFALGCVAGTVIAHLASLLVAPLLAPPVEVPAWLPVTGVWFAILALALRTLEEGLQPRTEAERYRHYQAALKSASDRFEAAQNLRERLLAAQGLERVSADEMRIFLRSNNDARFIM